jgi:Nucleolar pre-ribosomal-associated protein 1
MLPSFGACWCAAVADADAGAAAAPDVVAAYTHVSPAGAELFSALWAAAARPAVAAAALDCLLAVARYARGGGRTNRRSVDAVERARSIAKDVVKARTPALYVALAAAAVSPPVANKVLLLLTEVTSGRPLLAKEAVNRFDFGARTVATALCSGAGTTGIGAAQAGRLTRPTFTHLLVTLLNSGDHDVVWTLSTRSRHAIISALKAHADATASAAPKPVDSDAVDALLVALEERVLACPVPAVARSAFEAPVLETVAALATAGNVAAARLFKAVISAPRPVVQTPHVARVLADAPVTESAAALAFVLDAVAACPRAARMLLQTGPYVASAPRLSSAWLASAAVICRCTRELRTPTPVFARAKFLEKCWAHDSALVRHYGLLVAAALCKVVATHPRADRISRLFLPAPALVDAVLRKSAGADAVAHHVYGNYRTLFRREFEESKTDAIRIAVDAGYGDSPASLAAVVRACLELATDDALSTLFHRHLFALLISESGRTGSRAGGVVPLLLRDILLATRLFPVGTEHEVEVWLLSAAAVARGAALADFELFVAQAWAKPYALFDDLAALPRDGGQERAGAPMSLLSAAALRRLDKLGKGGPDSAEDGSSLHSVLLCAMCVVSRLCASPAAAAAIDARLAKHANFVPAATGQLAAVVGRLADRGSTGAVWDLMDCVGGGASRTVAGIVGRYLMVEGRAASSSPAQRAALLALLLKMTCHDAHSAGPLMLETLRATVEERDGTAAAAAAAAVYAAGILRAPTTATVRHAGLQALCTILFGGRKSLPADVRDVAYRSFADSLVVDGGLGLTVLDAQHVHDLISSFGRPEDSRDTGLVVETLYRLVTHKDPCVRCTAQLIVADAVDAGALRLDFSVLPPAGAASLAGLVQQVPAVCSALAAYLSAPSLVTPSSMRAVLPAVVASVLEGETSEAVLRACASSVLPALLSAESVEIVLDVADARGEFVDVVATAVRRLLDGRLCGEARALVASLLDSQKMVWRNRPEAPVGTLSSIVLRALFRQASANALLALEHPKLVGLLLAFPVVALTNDRDSSGVTLLHDMLLAAKERSMLTNLDVRRIEELEAFVSGLLVTCAKRAATRCGGGRERVCLLDLIGTSLQLDLMVDKVARDVLVALAGTVQTGSAGEMAALGRAVALAAARLPRLNVDETVATSLVALEGIFSAAGEHRGESRAEDACVHSAMRAIASALKSSEARRKYLLPERRGALFHADAADVIGMLDARRLATTADSLLGPAQRNGAPERYDATHVLSILRRAACEASARPTAAVLDLELVARSGLISVAIASLASGAEPLRVAGYAALAALTDAVGPESGVARDAAAALYRDRRQLAFMLNLLRTSIRSPLEQILPLFATFFRTALPVVLRPTHAAYREVTRFLLRTPTHNVHDADGLSCLLREEGEPCRRLALDILRDGIHTAADHHVAKRRHVYDTVFLFAAQLPAAVLAMLTAAVGQAHGQIAADLVRGHGILSWLAGGTFGDRSAFVDDRLRLLTLLATVLPRGVLCSRFAPCFVQALEELAQSAAAEPHIVADAAQAVARLTPTRRRQFVLDRRHQDGHLAATVYSKRREQTVREDGGEYDEALVVRAIMSCCQQPHGSKGAPFPATAVEEEVTQAFVAEAAISSAALRSSKTIRSALSCLLLGHHSHRVSVWTVVASLTALPAGMWTPDVHALADSVPGDVGDEVADIDGGVDRPSLSEESASMLAELLAPRTALAAGHAGGRSGRKRRRIE